MRYECCIGNFDGVHRGHQKLISQTVRSAREHGMIPAVIIFDPHPEAYFSGNEFSELTNLEQKKQLLYGYGIEEIIIFPFDDIIANMTASDFIQFVLNEMEIRKLLCGEDFRFGKNAEGDTSMLVDSKTRKFDVEVVDDLLVEGIKVSSRTIRQCIREGEMEKAVELLGHPYQIEDRGNILPPSGQYIVEMNGEQKEYRFNDAARIRKISFLKEVQSVNESADVLK